MNLLDKIFKPTIKANRVVSKIIDQYQYRVSNDISNYKRALKLAENGDRSRLILLYKEALRDNHLSGIIDLRKERILGTEFRIIDSDNNIYNDTYKFKSKWFYEFLSMFMCEIYYGFSLIQIDGIKNDNIIRVSQVPFENVKIETGELIPNIYQPYDTISYLSDTYYKWLLEVINDRTNLGLLADIVPLTIWKRSTMSAWAEYTEIFGMPIRIGKTTSMVEADRQRLANFLKGLAKSAWAVLDENESIEFVENNNSDAFNVYDKFIDRINGEISKRIIGGTEITDSHSGSGYAQSSTHNDQFSLKIKSDLRRLEFYINAVLFPKLVNLNVIPDGLKFKFDTFENLSLLDQIKIDSELGKIYPLDKDYLETKYRTKFTNNASSME